MCKNFNNGKFWVLGKITYDYKILPFLISVRLSIFGHSRKKESHNSGQLESGSTWLMADHGGWFSFLQVPRMEMHQEKLSHYL